MRWLALALALALAVSPAMAEMRGHGGPVRAIAISADGKTAVTGSFDTTVIVWDLERETAKQVLRYHEGPVSAVRMLGLSGFVTAGDDGRIAGWRFGASEPEGVWSHKPAPVVALSLYGAGQHGPMVSAAHADRSLDTSDGTLARFPVRTLTLRETPLAIAHVGAGETVVALGTQQLFFADSGRLVGLPANANALVSTPDGEIIAGGADGKLYLLTGEGAVRLAVEVQELPITSLAVSVDGSLIAAAGLRGAVKIIERATGREVSTLVGPGLPVWSLAFHPDGKTLLTGGADRMLRKWSVATGQPLSPAHAPRPDFPASAMNERGAQVFRACDACHTVTPDGGNRAGPTLHGVFGRRIGTAKDYVYSAGFAGHGIVWNAETITRLFRDGPAKVTPGTKMPEQRVTDEEDLAALVAWLEKVTR